MNSNNDINAYSARKIKLSKICIHLVLIIMCVGIVLSFLMVIGASLQSEKEIQTLGFRIFPKKLSFDAYNSVFHNPATLLRSYYVTFITTIIGAFFGNPFYRRLCICTFKERFQIPQNVELA